MRDYKLPWDVKQECLWIVRGYERRRGAYNDARRDILEASGSAADKSPVGGGGTPRPVEARQMKLDALEKTPETERMRAVEHALAGVGLDLPAAMRRKLQRALLLNCQDRKKYPYRMIEIPGVSAKKFYTAKEVFLTDIAAYLRLF